MMDDVLPQIIDYVGIILSSLFWIGVFIVVITVIGKPPKQGLKDLSDTSGRFIRWVRFRAITILGTFIALAIGLVVHIEFGADWSLVSIAALIALAILLNNIMYRCFVFKRKSKDSDGQGDVAVADPDGGSDDGDKGTDHDVPANTDERSGP